MSYDPATETGGSQVAEKLRPFDYSENGRRIRREMRAETIQHRLDTGAPGARKPLSKVGAKTATGELACPKCGSTQFTAKRSMLGKVGFGLLAVKSQVRCVACGTMFRRG